MLFRRSPCGAKPLDGVAAHGVDGGDVQNFFYGIVGNYKGVAS